VLISVIIPTVDREEGLARAIRAIIDQQIGDYQVEIVVVDNSVDAKQRRIVDQFSGSTCLGIAVRYTHEPDPGLASARNRGVAESEGQYVVFLDDDEAPCAVSWLSNLVGAVIHSGADAAFGPVQPRIEVASTQYLDFARRLYARDIAKKDGEEITHSFEKLGTGNSCFCRSTCFDDQSPAFSSAYNKTGGEDIDFLRRLRFSGKRFVWAPGAEVFEFIPAVKLSRTSLEARRFQQGQVRSFVQISSPPRRYDALLFWMTVGMLQIAYHFVAKCVAGLSGHDENVELHGIQIWGGIGKILWQERYRRNRYGISIRT
jgi:succinoglycan biosynthesis protein ExoM